MSENVLRETIFASNILLCISFIFHFILKFRFTTNRNFLYFFISFWISLCLIYLLRYVSGLPHIFIEALDLWCICAVGISSEYFNPSPLKKSNKSWIKWIAISIIVYLLANAVLYYTINNYYDKGEIFRRFGVFIWKYFDFLVTLFYGSRFLKIMDKKAEWIAILIYVYASIAIIFPMVTITENPSENAYLLLSSLTLPLKIVFYLSGYMFLNSLKESIITPQTKVDLTPVKIIKLKKDKNIPKPNVKVSLTGLWGLIYIMWYYPSGKLVISVIILSLLIATQFIITNLSTLKELFFNH